MTKKKPVTTAVDTARPRKDFREAYLNAGFYEDENGTLWGENSFVTATGEGDTFGPGHPRRPVKLQAVKTRPHTAQERESA